MRCASNLVVICKAVDVVQVLAGAGAVDHDELVDMAKSKFSNLPSGGISTADLIKQV